MLKVLLVEKFRCWKVEGNFMTHLEISSITIMCHEICWNTLSYTKNFQCNNVKFNKQLFFSSFLRFNCFWHQHQAFFILFWWGILKTARVNASTVFMETGVKHLTKNIASKCCWLTNPIWYLWFFTQLIRIEILTQLTHLFIESN